jgi:hypothetical protein
VVRKNPLEPVGTVRSRGSRQKPLGEDSSSQRYRGLGRTSRWCGRDHRAREGSALASVRLCDATPEDEPPDELAREGLRLPSGCSMWVGRRFARRTRRRRRLGLPHARLAGARIRRGLIRRGRARVAGERGIACARARRRRSPRPTLATCFLRDQRPRLRPRRAAGRGPRRSTAFARESRRRRRAGQRWRR